MSDAIKWSWQQAVIDSAIPATTKHLLLTLGCYMNAMGGSCYPSIKTLCEKTGLSNRTVITHIKIAEEYGFIKVKTHGFGGQAWKRQEYEASWPSETKGGEPITPPISKGGEAITPRSSKKGGEAITPRLKKGGEPVSKGGEPNDKKVVKEVHTNRPYNSPSNSPYYSDTDVSGEVSPLAIEKPISETNALNVIANPEQPPVEPEKQLDDIFQECAGDIKKLTWRLGATLLSRGGDEANARSFLGKQIKIYGEAAVANALIACWLEQPVEPSSYLAGCLKKQGKPLSLDFQPNEKTVNQLLAVGISKAVIVDSLDAFLMYMREREIYHSDFQGLFVSWVHRTWQKLKNDELCAKIRMAGAL